MSDTLPERIDPARLYSFAEACRLIPSCQAGKHLAAWTLRQWRRAGKLNGVVERRSGARVYYFLPGHEIIRLSRVPGPLPAPPAGGGTVGYRRAVEMAERLGI